MVALRTEDERPVSTRRVRAPHRSLRRRKPSVRLRTTSMAPLPLVRRDTLPERADYRDTGCELAESCLRCPLARCQYDVPGGARRLVIDARDREIALLRRRHHAPIDALAGAYALTRRSIFRILREQR